MKVKSLDHIHVYSDDPERSAEFYLRHFEAKTVTRNRNSKGDERIFLALGGQILVLGEFPDGHIASAPPEVGDGAYRHGFGVAHFGIRVESVERGVEEMKAADIQVLGELVREKTGLSYAYIEAPDGVIIELTEYGSSSS